MLTHAARPRLAGAIALNLALLLALYLVAKDAGAGCANPVPKDHHSAVRLLGRGINLGYALEQCLGHLVRPTGMNCKDGPAVKAAIQSIEEMLEPSGAFWKRQEIVNAESFRLPVAWWHHHELSHDGIVRVNDAYFELVNSVIHAARKARPDAVIVVNLHEFNKVIGNRGYEAGFFGARDTIEHPSGPIDRSGIETRHTNPDRTSGDDLLQIWQDVAMRLREHPPGCVYFELLNEPQRRNDKKGVSNYCMEDWRRHIGQLVTAIRATGEENRQRPLIIGTCNPGDHRDLEALLEGVVTKLRQSAPEINPLIVTWHYYDPFLATHWRARCPQSDPTGTGNRDGKVEKGCVTNPIRPDPYLLHDAPEELHAANREIRNDDHLVWKANIEEAFVKAEALSDQYSVALYLGEFGYERYIHRPWWPMSADLVDAIRRNRERWICEIVSQAERRHIAYSFWNMSASFGLNPDGRQSVADEAHNKRLIDLVLPGNARPQGRPPDCNDIAWSSER